MDGNRRYAAVRQLSASSGHSIGASKAHEVLDWCLQIGIQNVTLWGFSSDNASRTPEEVANLQQLFLEQAQQLAKDPRIARHKVRVRVIGDISLFRSDVREALTEIQEQTASYDGIQLNLALGYGGREEIVAATKSWIREQLSIGNKEESLVDSLDVASIDRHLWTAGLPDPDFIIRTSGELRLSGFLLWQSAYSEFYFCDAYWPDFRHIDFLRALRNFQSRIRRFGK